MNKLTAMVLGGLLFITPFSAFSEETENESPQNIQTTQKIAYVDDVIWISMREGNGKVYPNKAVLKSGTRLVILEQDEETKFSHVRRDNGDTGWVRTRYLRDSPIAALQLVSLKKKIEQMESQRATLQNNLNRLDQVSNTSSKQNKSLEKENARLKRDLEEIRDLSKNQISLHSSNTQLKQQVKNQKLKLDTLQEENKNISAKLYSYTISAGIISLLVGLYIGTIPVRREKRWRKLG